MTKLKYSICVFLLVLSLTLTVAAIVVLNRSDASEPADTTIDQAQTSQTQTAVPVVTDTPNRETTAETTEPTTAPTTEATTVPETTEQSLNIIGSMAAEIAVQQLGKEYKYGTAGPDTFDTSGLLQYCYKQCGVSLPRSNKEQAEFGYVIDKDELLPGDAVFFWSSTPGVAEYPGIYIGDGMVIAAMNSSKPVIQFNMNSNYYTEHFVCVRRFYD